MSKKWIALVLVIAIMLSLAACGGNSASQGTEAAAKSEQAPAEAGASTATTTKETLTRHTGPLRALQSERLYLHQSGVGAADQEERRW